jgi:hypothetical protein
MNAISHPKQKEIHPRHSPDDYAVWPDGSYATLQDVWNGEYNWLSDDYEVVAYDNHPRLIALAIYTAEDTNG